MRPKHNIITEYRNKKVTRAMAIKLVTKFLLQECILPNFIDEIKEIKPYQKGNDDVRYLISYAVTLSLQINGFCDIFLLPIHEFFLSEDRKYFGGKGEMERRQFWEYVNTKWHILVGDNIRIKPL